MKKVFVAMFGAFVLAASLSSSAAEKNTPIPAPELVPELPSRDNARVTQKNSTASAEPERTSANAAEEATEERVESRLAVIRTGRYSVTDPNVGRYDRAAGNGQRRVTPSMWQIFKF